MMITAAVTADTDSQTQVTVGRLIEILQQRGIL